ncbi:hypothetical protein LDENG_00288810 [Lucifuga dentata]|nr:hypothetical protein LDENG_00288810 [Lucifuga dentata]
MLTCQQFSTRIFFQYSILLDLLMEDSFKEYLHHILSYEEYVKNWIFDQMVEHFSNGSTKFEMENRHLQTTIRSIQDAIKKARNDKNGNLVKFVEDFCKELGDKLVISQDALGAFMILNNADKEQFADWLTECVGDMEEVLRKKCQKTDIKIKLEELHIKPQNELFTRVIGCGKQCPFCKAPCEAGGQAHTKHWASIHRPKGLGKFRWENSEKLTTDICSSSVISDISFRCHATNYKWHPYKKYAEIFPDWKIPPDGSLEASDYWKYVMTKFNKRFAKKYHANPADIPPTWKTITQKQAKESLKQLFAVK